MAAEDQLPRADSNEETPHEAPTGPAAARNALENPPEACAHEDWANPPAKGLAPGEPR